MNSEKTTTRKGFLKRAGLAFAGVFALTRSAHVAHAASSDSKSEPSNVASNQMPRAMSRIRPAKGAVERKIV